MARTTRKGFPSPKKQRRYPAIATPKGKDAYIKHQFVLGKGRTATIKVSKETIQPFGSGTSRYHFVEMGGDFQKYLITEGQTQQLLKSIEEVQKSKLSIKKKKELVANIKYATKNDDYLKTRTFISNILKRTGLSSMMGEDSGSGGMAESIEQALGSRTATGNRKFTRTKLRDVVKKMTKLTSNELTEVVRNNESIFTAVADFYMLLQQQSFDIAQDDLDEFDRKLDSMLRVLDNAIAEKEQSKLDAFSTDDNAPKLKTKTKMKK